LDFLFALQTPVSHIVSNGLLSMLEAITELPGVDINKPDNEGNTPLHFAAQAGKCISCV
jgi:ankyrin repeat protein